ncbi:PIN domain-containing protein [Streptomyces bacillaris]|uniref:PIN domain-containing protein n=1 Tax=Streptomyces bacillaris TaxID=68179 RepID=UPI00346161A7
MLIFDTNAVHDLDPHGAKADLLRLLNKAGLKVSVPWVVLEELAAHKLYDYQRAFDLMRRQHIELSALEPNLAGPAPAFQGDRFASHWRSQYSDVFRTIPTSESALRHSVLREAASMKPAKVDRTKKSGSRDVAIWFSILEYMEENPKEEIFFVSANTADFGQPDEWPFPLDVDLGDKVSRLTHLLSFDEVIEKFTTSSEAPADVGDILFARLSKKEASSAMMQEVWWRHLRRVFQSKSKKLPSNFHLGLEPQLTGAIECKSVETSTWYWSKVTWQVYALQGGGADPIVASWDTSILFPKDDEGGISLLRSGRLSEVDPGELSEQMASSLEGALAYESARTNEVPSQIDVDDLQEPLTLDLALPTEASRNAKSRRLRPGVVAANYAFRYESLVFDAIDRTVGAPQYVREPGNGIDATLSTPEGIIGIVIKFASHASSIKRVVPVGFLGGGVDAILIITNRSAGYILRESALGSRPEETIQWVNPNDDMSIARAVHSLRREMRFFNK